MKIINGKVFIDGMFRDVDVQFKDGIITNIGKDLVDDEVIDANGQYVYAGIVDTHCHGGFLRSFGYEPKTSNNGTVKEQAEFVCAKLPEFGVTTVFPTLASDLGTYEDELEAVRIIREIRPTVKGAKPLKFHFEITYPSLDRYLPDGEVHQLPSIEHTDWLVDNDYSDVAFICIAPDLPGSMEWLDYVVSKGVQPEVGYTKATAETIIEAANHGLCHCSHIFNGYLPMHHRESSPAVGILLDDRIKAQITMDGYHVAPAWVKLVIKTKGIENCYGLTDLSSMSGLPEGLNVLPDGTTVLTKDGYNWRSDGHILSGNMTMDQIMLAARDRVGLTMEEVGILFTENPAKCTGLTDRGKIEVGRLADFVIMDKDYHVLETIIDGETYYKA